MYSKKKSALLAAGFTLIELAIVLGVTGLLFGGLWRLMSSGNSQMRDQAVASQHQQLANAAYTFLQSSNGFNWLRDNVNTSANLPLPTDAACSGSVTAFCQSLPQGFLNTTTNSYGQTYVIRVLKNPTGAGVDPLNFSFMVFTAGGDTIPDSSGGRISAMIGGDGGFIYTDNVCTNAGGDITKSACGAYGGWNIQDVNASYGYNASTSGHVASRTFSSVAANSGDNFLWRNPNAGDTAANVKPHNTMTTNMYLGGQRFYLGTDNTLTTGGGNIFAQGGTYNGQGGTIDLNSAAGTINLAGGTFNMGGGTINGNGTVNMAGGLVNMGGGTINMNTAGNNLGGGDINMSNGKIDLGAGGGGAIYMRGGNLHMNNIGTTAGGGNIALEGGGITYSNVNFGAVGRRGELFDTLAGPQIVFDSGTPLVNTTGAQSFIRLNTNCTIETNTDCNAAINVVQGDIAVGNRLNANSLFAQTFIYQGSDRRLKEDIKILDHSLSKILAVTPVSYKMKSTGQKSMGVIAQEIEAIYPDVVTQNGDGLKAVNYQALIAPLIKAVQELNEKNEQLAKKLELQSKEIESLKKKNTPK